MIFSVVVESRIQDVATVFAPVSLILIR